MSRTAAKFTQADVNRALRAALRLTGSAKVELRPDGTIVVLVTSGDKPETEQDDPEREVVL